MNGPIFDAADSVDIEDVGTVPNVENVLLSTFVPISFGVVTANQDPITFEFKDTIRTIESSGNAQPLSNRELAIKAEGDRAWEWLKVYATPDLVLQPRDVVIFKGTRYRVMASKNYAKFGYGYVYYELVNDYQYGTRGSLNDESAA